MRVESLTKMANEISDFFVSEADHAAAVDGVAQHIRSFWDPRMRRQIYTHEAAGGDGLSALSREAIRHLAAEEHAATG